VLTSAPMTGSLTHRLVAIAGVGLAGGYIGVLTIIAASVPLNKGNTPFQAAPLVALLTPTFWQSLFGVDLLGQCTEYVEPSLCF
jgi:hypothetical protein